MSTQPRVSRSQTIKGRRFWVDQSTRFVVAAGGAAVIGAIAMIFAYLVWIAFPLILPGDIASTQTLQNTAKGDSTSTTLFAEPILDGSAVLSVATNGNVNLHNQSALKTGISSDYSSQPNDRSQDHPRDRSQQHARTQLSYKLSGQIHNVHKVYPTTDTYAVVDRNGVFTIFRTRQDSIESDRLDLEQPFPGIEVNLFDGELPTTLDVSIHQQQLLLAAAHKNRVQFSVYDLPDTGESGASNLRSSVQLESTDSVQHIFLGPRQEWVYLVSATGSIELLNIQSTVHPERVLTGPLIPSGSELTAVTPLLGRHSLLVADNQGYVYQWMLQAEGRTGRLLPIRQFQLDSPAKVLTAEHHRKGFAALSQNNTVTLFHATSHTLIDQHQSPVQLSSIAFAERADVLLGFNPSGEFVRFNINNPHPEITQHTLWQKVWYEGYSEPIYAWQSSSADREFEPKFSLTPLAFGTLKAAVYALLFAIPIAILGAIYTAYFMHPIMRNWVKPGIEVMAALPTVVLGFIGGLWLAPIIEQNLSSLLGVFLIVPLGLGLASYGWHHLPRHFKRMNTQWLGLIACPLLVILTLLAFQVGSYMEIALFGGDSRAWLLDNWGLSYEQRNAMIVGIIMGFAVIPTIFSLCEDAIYAVPQHLSQGALALGATRWQTLTSVVLLTASPGLFSAVMIGAGRAVGETMIVLMVTGNTPVMEFNIFEGMRTFASNIAVELPEAEVASTHFRLLFLSALLLFVFTFLFNTVADIVRQRLRVRYGNL